MKIRIGYGRLGRWSQDRLVGRKWDGRPDSEECEVVVMERALRVGDDGRKGTARQAVVDEVN